MSEADLYFQTGTNTNTGLPIFTPVAAGNPIPTTSSIVAGGTVTAKIGPLTIVPLDVATVTTGGTAVTALTAGHRTAGGWIKNPESATINLGINEIGTAAGTISAGSNTFIPPGQSYTLAPSPNAVSIISSDSAHPFSGYGFTPA